jgi:hypothetical protein
MDDTAELLRHMHPQFRLGHSAARDEAKASIVKLIAERDAARSLIFALHEDGTLSEGQCCKALGMERVDFRTLVDEFNDRVENATPEQIRAAALTWCLIGTHRRADQGDVDYFENNWRGLPGLRIRVIREIVHGG